MGRSRMRLALGALVAIAVAFVAVGGPATAARWIDGGDIKPGSVGGRQIANGAISARKLSRSAKRSLAGKPGPQGPAGAAGAAGARGPAGAFNLVDNDGKVIGVFAGFYNSNYYAA